jgi:hypothetical protein
MVGSVNNAAWVANQHFWDEPMVDRHLRVVQLAHAR